MNKLKKTYVAPELVSEEYQLNMSIASNCKQVVTNGPAIGGREQCDDYYDPHRRTRTMTADYNVGFYEDTCDCYTTGGDSGYWQS